MIRAAELADCAALAAIDAQSNPSPWSEKQFRAAVEARHDAVYLLEKNGEPAAFIVWQSICGESELHLIATAPAFRRQGSAAGLMDFWLAQAAAEQNRRLFLEVRAGNEAAQSLYRRYGFQECGRRKDYYPAAGNQREDAVLMEKLC
ncbi:MAG: ribosomal protein S18-alanine N-acetyltransferase [Neisseria sp.]|nr:ribosomal protein S18-alanine N-acetyltransferase [Neisseria sp.]